MKKKIALNDLEIRSFATSNDRNVKGGTGTTFSKYPTIFCTQCGDLQCGA